jgi:hypothetical protein
MNNLKEKSKVKDKDILTIEKMTGKEVEEIENSYNDEGESINDKVSLMAISELLNLNKLKTISRVKFEQVAIITKLLLFADVFEITFTKNLSDYILQLLISVGGLGRKELVALVQQRGIDTDLINNKNMNSSKNIFK